MDFDYTYADYINKKGITEIEGLENELETTLLAYYAPPAPARLSDDQLQKVNELEKKLCIRLVAFDTH